VSWLVGDRATVISLFVLFIAGCLFVAMLASPDLQHGGGGFFAHPSRSRPLRQGLALTGDFVSAAGVLYFCGIVAETGYDGVLLVVAAALSPLLLKVWLAERLPGGPGRSLGDVLARRLPSGPARRAAGWATLVVSVPLLIAQLVPIGRITAALMGVPGRTGEITGIVLVGVLICACAGIGGVRGATLLQIGKTLALVVAAPLLVVLVLAQFDWNYGELLTRAAAGSGAGDAYLAPGRLFGTGAASRLDTLSLGLTVLFGTAFLPHLLTRLSASPTAGTARRATSWAVLASCLLCAAAAVTGYGIQALVDSETLRQAGPRGGDNVLLLAAVLDGVDPGSMDAPGTLLTFVSCVAFLTVLASASVLLLAGSAAIVHDLRHEGRPAAGQGPAPGGLRARTALLLVGGACIGLAVTGRTANAQFWLTLSYTEAATVVLPAVAYSLLWSRFTLRGLRWCVHGGTCITVALLALSPAVSGSPHALVPDADWSVFPLHAPGLVSIPAAFLLGALGSLRRRQKHTPPQLGTPDGERVNAAGASRS
jgi:Na+(H+)/acetate symporter ActP